MALSYAEPASAYAGAAVDAVRRRLVAPMPTDRVAGWVASLSVFLVALGLRLLRLGLPGREAFDEVYYHRDAYNLWKHGAELNDTQSGPGFIVHPPVGKWMLGLGQWLFGDGLDPTFVKGLSSPKEAFSWRFSAALFGALSVLILCRLGRRLFRSTLLGCAAGLLMALDGLHFTMSRIALLDIFLLFWILAAAACLLADRDDLRRRVADAVDRASPAPWRGRWTGFRPWRIAAGVCLGLAVGTKWSGVFFLLVAMLLSFGWEIGARRAAGIRRPAEAALHAAVPIIVTLAFVPVVVYIATWAGWFAGDVGWRRVCDTTDPAWAGQGHLGSCGPIKGLARYHLDILGFHNQLSSKHSYQSHPWGWLILYRPVAYWYTTPRPGTSRAILGIGTPAIWWASMGAIVVTSWRWLSARDWRAAFILAGFAANFLPWFYYDWKDRTMFLFYALPAVPFMCLALAYCCGLAVGGRRAGPDRRMWGTLSVGAYLFVVIANFVWLYPVLAAKIIDYQDWRDRMWFSTWL